MSWNRSEWRRSEECSPCLAQLDPCTPAGPPSARPAPIGVATANVPEAVIPGAFFWQLPVRAPPAPRACVRAECVHKLRHLPNSASPQTHTQIDTSAPVCHERTTFRPTSLQKLFIRRDQGLLWRPPQRSDVLSYAVQNLFCLPQSVARSGSLAFTYNMRCNA